MQSFYDSFLAELFRPELPPRCRSLTQFEVELIIQNDDGCRSLCNQGQTVRRYA